MDLRPYIETLSNEFGLAAEAGGPEYRALAERLAGQLEAAIRLTLLEAISDATAEITHDLAPGSVHVRLQGREPAFVVDVPRPEPERAAAPEPAPPAVAEPPEDGATIRINLRLPEHLKDRADAAASAAGLSANAWLVRAVAAALEPAPRAAPGGRGQRVTGWVR